MAEKTPVRVVFNASNVATGLAEFQSGDAVGIAFGGTGLNAIGGAGQVIKVNAAGTALEFGAEGDLSITNLVAPSNADLTLSTSGTGNIVLDAITVRGTTISSADSSTININDNVEIDGNLVVTGTVDFNDQNISNVGSLSIDSISGDADTNTSITFSGSDVITIATGGSGRLTVGDGALSPVTDSQIDLGTSSLYYKDAYIDSITTTGNVSIGGNLDVTGTLDLSDSNFTNVGALQLDSIAGDSDTNTSITFSGSDVITVATGGSTAATFNADQSASLSGALTVTGVTTLTGGVSTNSVTGDVIPGKIAGTNFTEGLLIGHATTGTLNSAEKNTGVGIEALDALTSGDRNTAVGAGAGTSITGTSFNTMIGTNSMRASGGNHNTALGNASGINVTGDYNVLLGSTSGDNITSGDGNVIIGSVDAGSATGDRQLLIAGNDGSTTTTWIKGDSSGKVSFPGGDGSGIGILSNTISTAASNADINITPHGTGGVVITSGGTTFNLPTADGSAGQALVTDGSGTLSFETVATIVSDDTLATVKNSIHLGTAVRTIDSTNATFIDSAFYFLVYNDLVNEVISAECLSLTNNDSASFIGNRRGLESAGGSNVPTLTTDVSNGQFRFRASGGSADCLASFYKIAFSSSTTDATRGNTVTTSNTDVDSASESIDSFAHASFRGAKYFISVDNDSKTEMDVVEALVVHDGTNAFITSYGHNSSNGDPSISLTAAIDGSNVVVSAAGLETNLNLTIHKILLKDNMTASSNANQKAFASVTVSSTATAIDLMDLDDGNGAVYFIVGANSSEGAFSIQEVYTAATPGEPAVANGPFVSSKGSSQLGFTVGFDTSSDNSLELFASSTSGGSTTVSGYRISAFAG